jgi:hypothetical protein
MSEPPALLPHPGTYDIHDKISAANPSYQLHYMQHVAIVVHIHGVSTLAGTRVHMPQFTIELPRTLGFWPATEILSKSAYSIAHDDCTRGEFRQLLAQLSSWAVAFLPIIDDSETKSTLKLLSFLGTHVSLSSGANGVLCGWSAQGWLISGRGGCRWVQSAEILVAAGNGKGEN